MELAAADAYNERFAKWQLELQIAYAIGVTRPVSVTVYSFGTGKLPDAAIFEHVGKHFGLYPSAIIERQDMAAALKAKVD